MARPVKARSIRRPSPDHGLGEAPRGLVLVDIAGLESGHDDGRDRRRAAAPRHARRRTVSPFLRTRPSALHAMRHDGADAVLDRNRSEFHAALLSVSARNGFLRRPAMISPSTETAISAGLTAPMSRPIGAWMRSIAACVEAGRRAAGRPGPHGFCASRARRCRSTRPAAPRQAPDRRSWDRG